MMRQVSLIRLSNDLQYVALLFLDMAQVEEKVRSIQAEGLVWGASKLVPVAYGIKALQITCVVQDDKVCVAFRSTN